MFDPLWCIQGIGALLGILGAIINTSPDIPTRVLSFRVWMVANTVLLGWAVFCSVFWFALLYLVYLATALLGLVRNRPRQEATA